MNYLRGKCRRWLLRLFSRQLLERFSLSLSLFLFSSPDWIDCFSNLEEMTLTRRGEAAAVDPVKEAELHIGGLTRRLIFTQRSIITLMPFDLCFDKEKQCCKNMSEFSVLYEP